MATVASSASLAKAVAAAAANVTRYARGSEAESHSEAALLRPSGEESSAIPGSCVGNLKGISGISAEAASAIASPGRRGAPSSMRPESAAGASSPASRSHATEDVPDAAEEAAAPLHKNGRRRPPIRAQERSRRCKDLGQG